MKIVAETHAPVKTRRPSLIRILALWAVGCGALASCYLVGPDSPAVFKALASVIALLGAFAIATAVHLNDQRVLEQHRNGAQK